MIDVNADPERMRHIQRIKAQAVIHPLAMRAYDSETHAEVQAIATAAEWAIISAGLPPAPEPDSWAEPAPEPEPEPPAPEPVEEMCGTCRFYVQQECKRFPPAWETETRGYKQPFVDSTDWCGEWRASPS